MNISSAKRISAATLSVFIYLGSVASVQAACVDITIDLGAGSSDKTAAGQVIALQNFLRDEKLLAATPNGYFGPATTAAVKMFQVKSGVSSTGFVGPLTRAAIKAESCAVSTAPTPVSETPKPTTPMTAAIAPKDGENIVIGKTYDIAISGQKLRPQNIILLDKNGTAKGFIASSILGVSNYTWKAGTVYSSASNRNEIVPPGEYRIRIEDAWSGASSSDLKSGLFELVAEAASIKSLMPASVSAESGAAVVIYGQGYTSSTRVYLGGYRNIEADKLFISTDGAVYVFSVPRSTPAGTYVITLSNRYGWVDTASTLTVTR